jgi:glucokinase
MRIPRPGADHANPFFDIIAAMSQYISIDIGGTQLRAALFSGGDTTPVESRRAPTQGDGPIFDRLVRLVEDLWPQDGSVHSIGIASPGPLDPHTGMILKTPNIKEWVNFPLAPKMAGHFGVPAYLDNDANLAALGEWRFGAGRGHRDVLFLTVSTGIGGGAICSGHLVQGVHGLATEFGHMTLVPDGPLCGCGFRGHLEALASGPSITRYVREQIDAGIASSLTLETAQSARDVAEAARAGDELATAAFKRAGDYLGLAVANLLHAFNPSIVIFGGGVSQSGPLLFEPFQASLKKYTFNPHYLDELIITTAALGDDAGLLGALALATMDGKI